MKCKNIISLFLFGISVLGRPAFCPAQPVSHHVIDQAESRIIFKCRTTFHPIDGKIEQFRGRLSAASTVPALNASGGVYLRMESMSTGNAGLDRNMHRMFESDKYPQAHCRIQSFSADFSGSDRTAQGRLRTVLTIREKSVPWEGPTTVILTQEGFIVRGQALLSLKAFDLRPPAMLFFIRVKDAVTVDFNVTFKREE